MLPPVIHRFGTRLSSELTLVTTEQLLADQWNIIRQGDPALAELGIELNGNASIAVRTMHRKLGKVKIDAPSESSLFLFENNLAEGTLILNLQAPAPESCALFCLRGLGITRVSHVLMRSPRQAFFMGFDATAVELKIVEIEGEGHGVYIGDDALISSGVVIRNYDMHSVIDLSTGTRTNSPVDTLIQQHVWVGQDAFLLCCESVGYGSIIGAQALARRSIPPKTIAVGSPTRVVRSNSTWGRHTGGISPKETALLQMLDKIAGHTGASKQSMA